MPTEGEEGSAETPQAQTAPTARVLYFTWNFPVPSPMKVPGDRVTNWEFFRQQWEDYELGTGLEHRHFDQSCMGKDCLQIFLNLNLKLTQEEQASVSASLAALKKYFSQTYERFLFNSATQNSEEGIDEFVNRLRKMPSSKKHEEELQQMWRTKEAQERRM